MPSEEIFQRLPSWIKPRHYGIILHPDLIECVYKGSVEVELEIKEPTKDVVLNCVDLELTKTELICNGKTLLPSSVVKSEAKEIVTLTFNENLKPGSGLLKINFEGKLKDNLLGFYRTKYTVNGEERYGAVTQFEPANARNCFPCWDEPALKATFDVTLIVPADRVALSNMNEISREPYPDNSALRIVRFATSPLMSTYLLVVVIGEFDVVQKATSDGVDVRVYTPLGKKEQGLFSLDIGVKVIPYYNEYFKISYPLPKCDLVAVPDLNPGAMECWGLITFREELLLVDPKNSSSSMKQNVASCIGHEISHQWFGNLVTMEWWTHLWLNEGYASFVENMCVEFLFPEYCIWKQFVSGTYTRGLELDSLKNSHPIEVPVNSPAEVEEIFDEISYNKGASIIRMLHDYMGYEHFRKGMQLYLERHKYNNAFTEDLWSALEEGSGKPITSTMTTWTKQMGFPMITVSCTQEGDDRIISISQQRFISDGSKDLTSQWIVPISFCSSDSPTDPVKRITLDTPSSQLVLKIPKESWLKLNVGAIGFYRVKYDEHMLAQILPAMTSKQLQPLDRLNVLSDLFAMVKAGYVPTTQFFDMIKALENETEYIVWSTISTCISHLNKLLLHTSYYDLFVIFIRKLLLKIYQKVGWEPETGEVHMDMLLRSLIIKRMSAFGDEAFNQECKHRMAAHIEGTAPIPADLRAGVYQTIAKGADEATLRQMIQLHKETDLQEEKNRIAVALGATGNPSLIQTIFEFAMSDEVKVQDKVFVIISVGGTLEGRNAVWSFFKANITLLLDIFQSNFLIMALVKYTIENFESEEKAVEVEEFFQKHPVESAERIIKQSLESIRRTVAWLKRDTINIEKYLKAQC